MATIKGYDFRASLGYVTDPANHVFINSSVAYPTTDGHGFSSGWVAGANDADRNSGLDARLAGICYAATSATRTFRITLPSTGIYEVRLAVGDIFAQSDQQYHVFDDTTEFITVTVATGGNQWADATGVVRTSDSNWSANNVAVTRTFVSTTLNVQLGPNGADAVTLSHLSILDVTPQVVPAQIVFKNRLYV